MLLVLNHVVGSFLVGFLTVPGCDHFEALLLKHGFKHDDLDELIICDQNAEFLLGLWGSFSLGDQGCGIVIRLL